jgi:hypothetical protein
VDTNALRARIADELGRTDLAAQTNREINGAIQHYESTRFRWNEEREATITTTVSGTRTYALPAAFISFDSLKVVRSGSFIPLRKITWEEMEEGDLTVTGARGVPTEYVVYGNVLRLFPVPNAALTLVGSYIRRFGLTSLTGSFCLSQTMTPTTTASHNNRRNGWTIDGEELLRARAKAAVRINYIYDEAAIKEHHLLLQSREPYLSVYERLVFERLADETSDALASGRIRPHFI